MKKTNTKEQLDATETLGAAWQEVGESFERFCLTAGISALSRMMEEDAENLCGPRHGRSNDKDGYRWGHTTGRLDFHGGTIPVERPRVRRRGGKEMSLPSWKAAEAEGWLGKWAMNLMLLNVSTRKFGRAVRLPEGDVPAAAGDSRSKSAVSRRFVQLSAEQLAAWMSADLSQLDLLAIQIDGLHFKDDLMLVAAVGIDSDGVKHPLAVIEGATENTATVQALLGNLVDRGLDSATFRLFIVDGAKALTKAIRRTFGRDIPIQRCQVHKARNILERLPKHLHVSVRKTLRQAWDTEDTARAEKLIENLARRLEREAPGVSASILEGIDEILTVSRLRLPQELKRSLACTNIIENMNGTIRRVCANVKRWRNASMALRWSAAGMIEAAKGFRRLKASKQLPALKAALQALQAQTRKQALEPKRNAA
jgi:transposase-like protein